MKVTRMLELLEEELRIRFEWTMADDMARVQELLTSHDTPHAAIAFLTVHMYKGDNPVARALVYSLARILDETSSTD